MIVSSTWVHSISSFKEFPIAFGKIPLWMFRILCRLIIKYISGILNDIKKNFLHSISFLQGIMKKKKGSCWESFVMTKFNLQGTLNGILEILLNGSGQKNASEVQKSNLKIWRVWAWHCQEIVIQLLNDVLKVWFDCKIVWALERRIESFNGVLKGFWDFEKML